MEDYRRLSDQELIRMLKLYNIPHGPIVGSTRKLYEKKIYEYESQRTKFPPGIGSSLYTGGDAYRSQDYPGQDEEEDLDEVDYDNYYEESYSTTKTYREGDNAAIPVAKARSSLQDPLPTTSYSSSDSTKKPTFRLRQRIRENILYPLSQEDAVDSSDYFDQDAKTYQNVSHCRSSTGAGHDFSSPTTSFFSSSTPVSSTSHWYSLPLEVEARQAIRASQSPEAKVTKDGRLVPLWVQFLLFIGFALFLAFFYYFMQADDDNPFHLQN